LPQSGDSEVDTGSDNSTEIEMNNLTNAYYDVERFGISFVASPRHADVWLLQARSLEL
jgi:Ni,Fe-hydrogenase III small subunit